MIEIAKFFKENNLKSKLIMQVHDELVFSVKKDEKEKVEKNVKSIMEKVLESYKLEIRNYKLDESQIIPLVVDV
jgi:DNA polymerase-1